VEGSRMMIRDFSARARSAPTGLFLWLTLSVGCAAGCGEPGDAGGDAAATGLPSADERTFVTPEDFLGRYWVRPIPPQGRAPDEFSPLEASLHPAACGTCHPNQYADWQTTVHAGAYSPGLSGQLVNWEEGSFQRVRACLVCHTPLSEQSARLPVADGGFAANPDFEPELRDHGLVCAGCHERGQARYGPPRRDGSIEPSPPNSPHGGVTRTSYFEDSRFCAGCHQFEAPAPNGKSIQNTYTEWQNSRYASAGVTCQSCHMPDQRHLWRGIHDPEMVRSGITIEWVRQVGAGAPEIGLRVTNRGTGHAFPTYVTPEVGIQLQLLDADRRPLDEGLRELVIARRVVSRNGVWVELSDTRLLPDSSATVTVAEKEAARFVRGSVVVRPDAFYLGLFQSLLAGSLSDTSRALLRQAKEKAAASPFSVFEETVPLSR
jgi:hypothetical protein